MTLALLYNEVSRKTLEQEFQGHLYRDTLDFNFDESTLFEF